MIKLVDSTRDLGNGSVLTLFADSKDDFDAETITIVGFSGEVPAGSKVITADGATGFYKSDGSIAWQGETPTGPYFIVEDGQGEEHTYSYDESTTMWYDFVDSQYNDGYFSREDGQIRWNEHPLVYEDHNNVYSDDTITEGYTYYEEL